jgi:Kdo2-lipid IVA lauroyltransferase/acyltransferase
MFLVKALSRLPFWLLYAIGHTLSFLAFHIFQYRRKVVHQNLVKAFPDLSEKVIKKHEIAFYIQFVQVFIESIKGYRFTQKDWVKRVPLKNPELLTDYLEKGQPVILLSGHTANWEWPAFSIGQQIGYPIEFLYKPVKSEKADQMMLKLRTRHGGNAIPKDTALRQIIKRKMEPRIVGILADQLPSIGADKYWIHFLNQPRPFTRAPKKLPDW